MVDSTRIGIKALRHRLCCLLGEQVHGKTVEWIAVEKDPGGLAGCAYHHPVRRFTIYTNSHDAIDQIEWSRGKASSKNGLASIIASS